MPYSHTSSRAFPSFSVSTSAVRLAMPSLSSGRVFAKQVNPTNRASDYVPAFIVHDDQSGPYMWLPADKDASSTHSFEDDTIRHDAGSGPIELNVQSHAVLAIALMSTRVFSTAARAEHNARSQINEILKDMPNARRALAKLNMPVNEMLMDELQAAHSAGNIVLRTYLTSAAGYRRHLAQGSARRRPERCAPRPPLAPFHMDHRDLHH